MPSFRTIFARRSALTPLLFAAIFATFFGTLSATRGAFGAGPAGVGSNADVLAPIAQFIDSKTLFVARVDLAQVDFGKLGETLDSIFAGTLKAANAPDAAVADVQKEFAKTLDAAKKIGSDALEAFRQGNFREAFVVVQNASGDGLAIIVPATDLSAGQTEAIKALAENADLNCALYKKAFLVASPKPLKEFGAFYRTFRPGLNSELSKFFRANGDKIAAFYCGRFRIRAVVDAATGGASKFLLETQPKSVRSALETFDATLGDVRGFVDAGTLSGRIEIRFRAASDAARMRTGLEEIVDDRADAFYESLLAGDGLGANPLVALTGAADALEAADQIANAARGSDPYKLAPLLRELYRGSSRARLPKQNGDRLTFEFSLTDATQKSGGAAFAVAGVAVGLLLPAVQAARSKAREIQEQNAVNPFESEEFNVEIDAAPESDGADAQNPFENAEFEVETAGDE